jgi:tetratricopeptide (TPR) repeat protein
MSAAASRCAAALGLALLACSRGAQPGEAEDVGPRVEAAPRSTASWDLTSLDAPTARELTDARAAVGSALAQRADDATVAAAAGRLAMLAMAYDLSDIAEEALELALERDPEEPRWLYYQARLLRQRGEPEAAVAALRHQLRREPGDRAAAILLAETLLEMGRSREAAEVAGDRLRRAPDDAAALQALGRAELALGDTAAAAQHLEQALAAAPQATLLYHSLALAYRASGRADDARRALAGRGPGRVEVPDPRLDEVTALATGARALESRAAVEIAAGRYPAAIELLTRLLEAEPSNQEARLNLATALLRLSRVDQARAELDAVLRAEPENADARFALGALLARQDRDAEAIVEYERALAVRPGTADVLYNLGNALRRTGRVEDAAERYRQAIEADPGHRPARYALGVLLMESGEWRDAMAELEAAHAALPDDPRIANALARLLASAPIEELRDGPRALALAEGLYAGDRSVFHGEALAMALAAVGRFDDAARQQTALVEAARYAGRVELEPTLVFDLERYRRHEPSRGPSALP